MFRGISGSSVNSIIEVERDKSGNIRLPDIGSHLRTQIKSFFAKEKMEIALKYVDPSYMIRR